jgi:hypothetical protein
MEVEDKVELAHVAKELIQYLYEQMDDLQQSQLVIRHIDAQAEEQASIPPVNHLIVPKLDNVGELWITRNNQSMNLILNFSPVLVVVVGVPSRQPSLSLPVLKQDEPNHYNKIWN